MDFGVFLWFPVYTFKPREKRVSLRENRGQEAAILQTFLEQMEAVDSSNGLAYTGSQLHRAGHPEFRQPKEVLGAGG